MKSHPLLIRTSSASRRPRRPSRLRGHGPIAPGSALPAQDGELALPHERDESPGSASTAAMGSGTAGARQREVMGQAARDLAEGQVDTDLRASPGLDAERREALLKEAAQPHGAAKPPGPRRRQR